MMAVQHDDPHLHPVTGACDCLNDCCSAERGDSDLCVCTECNGKCDMEHPGDVA